MTVEKKLKALRDTWGPPGSTEWKLIDLALTIFKEHSTPLVVELEKEIFGVEWSASQNHQGWNEGIKKAISIAKQHDPLSQLEVMIEGKLLDTTNIECRGFSLRLLEKIKELRGEDAEKS